MPQRKSAEMYQADLRRAVVDTCRSVLAEELPIVEAARALTRLSHDLVAERDEDFLFFVGIDSETDHFPVGAARDKWNREALDREDAARLGYEATVAAEARKHCANLLQRYADGAV